MQENRKSTLDLGQVFNIVLNKHFLHARKAMKID